MVQETQTEILGSYLQCWSPPFTGSFEQWSHLYINKKDKPFAGAVSFDETPYLRQPSEDLIDPSVYQLNLLGGTQTGKTFLGQELYIPWLAINSPCKLLKFHLNQDTAKHFTQQRLIPLMEQCALVKPLLNINRYQMTATEISLPNGFNVKATSPSDNYLHGFTALKILLDEAHEYPPGTIDKLIARTDANAMEHRKIVISSQPNVEGSELYKYYQMGKIFQWHWCCPNPDCKKYQPFYWFKEREDGSYAGFNWNDHLNEDGTRNISLTAKSTWLECLYCRHEVKDTEENRRYLNDTGKYYCIKSDGDAGVHSYIWPKFVNRGLSFEYFARQFLNAKHQERIKGYSDDVITFKNQVLGEFYTRQIDKDISSLVVENYNPQEKWDKEGIRILTADIQRSGFVKYYVVRAWSEDGKESRQLERNIVRDWDQLKEVQTRWGIPAPCVGIDAGDGEFAHDIYSKCLEFADKIVNPANNQVIHLPWTALKGDDASDSKFKDKNDVFQLYSQPFQGDPLFADHHPLKGKTTPGYRWDSTKIKAILIRLRDGLIPGVKWVTNKMDKDYEQQMWAEGWGTVVNKQGLSETKWVVHSDVNHWLDAEAMNLCMAVMLQKFTVIQPPKDEESKKAA